MRIQPSAVILLFVECIIPADQAADHNETDVADIHALPAVL